MSIRDQFSDDQWFKIATAPSLVGSAMATAGHSGAMGTMKEIMASAMATTEVAKEYAGNSIIAAIIPNQESDKDAAKAEMDKLREQAKETMAAAEIKSADELSAFALQSLKDALDLLNGAATEAEVGEYKAWVKLTGQKVAEAAKEGGFLGIGGERVSEAEAAFLAQLDDVLG